MRRSHPKLGQLVHRSEAGDARVADQLVAVLADPETAVGLSGHELDEGALAPPLLADLLRRSMLVRSEQWLFQERHHFFEN